MSAAILLALVSAVCYGLGLTFTQIGLRDVPPASGAAISIPSSALLFVAVAPFWLDVRAVDPSAALIFAGVGLMFPAAATLITFESNRALGPVITGSLGNLAPLFAVVLAFAILGEPLRLSQIVALVVILAGVWALTGARPGVPGRLGAWYLALPLIAAALRGLVQPVVKLGLAHWPSSFAAALIGYIVSATVVIVALRLRTGHWRPAAPRRGALWFSAVGVVNGLAVLLMYAALTRGPVALVAPLVATYPLVTVTASALVLHKVDLRPRMIAGAALTVVGVVLLLVT
jgi:drug/metabolite transporter (DMT)-like permease